MKNLQIGDNDLIGNRFNGHDLHKYLRQRGILSDHLVRSKQSDDPDTYILVDDIQDRDSCNTIIQRIESHYSTHSLHYPFSFSLFNHPLFIEADIVHYHLIHNSFFNLNLLPTLTALKPSVWTLHDPWPMTGHCIYPFDCQRWKFGCGDCCNLNIPFVFERDTTALNWEIKRDIFKNSQIDLVVASEFMLDMVKQSPMFSLLDVHHIPFGIDLKRFSVCDGHDARMRLEIPEDNVVICFRADSSPFKGFEYVKESLERLNVDKPVTLLSVGNATLMNSFQDRYHVINMGWVTDDDKMLDVYRAADIFLMPSMAEAFGMMAMESMACGKPVIVFEGTSLPKITYAPEGGIAVPQGNVDAFTHELEQLIIHKDKRMNLGSLARKLAEQHYDKDNYVSKIIGLYQEIIEKRKINDRSRYIIEQMKKVSRKSQAVKETAWSCIIGESPRQVVDERSDQCDELSQIKSSVYYRVYDKLRKRPSLRFISNKVIKPAIRGFWWLYKKTKH